ncbi:MAG: ABC transporter permease [bacterium]|nr:ABC transporter permease [bacterium]
MNTYLIYGFKTALNGLKANKSRSSLTILGIVIGIAAIILIMAIGQGAQDLILNQIRGLGSETIFVGPGREPQGPSEFTEILSDSLKNKEVEALKDPAMVPGVKRLSPIVLQVMTVAFENETKRINVVGASDLLMEIMEIYPEKGIFFGEEEIKQYSSVVVLGYEVKKELFGDSDALGEKIKIKDRNFKVIGALPQKGRVGMFDVDNMVVVPYTTLQKYVLGTNFYNTILVQAEGEAAVTRVAGDIERTLRELHNIDDPSKDDFHVMTQVSMAERVGIVTDALTALLLSVAAISLIVGGIGIMNIMLVSVTERTREIGLRKAVGATENDILIQFLLEAVLLTAIGGIIGIAVGAGFSFLTSLILTQVVGFGWGFSFPFSAAAAGLIVSSLVGLIFGLYPARKAAAKKDPIEALRYE